MTSQTKHKPLKQFFIEYGLLFEGDSDVEQDLKASVRDWIQQKRKLPRITICLEDYNMGRNDLINELLQELKQ